MQILYQDSEIIAINKPAGMLVHRTKLATDVTENFAVQVLRDMIGQHVNPVHRLDRPTSGVLLFGLNSEITALLKKQFDDHTVKKEYLAVVRGYCEESAVIEEPLYKENGTLQEAITHYQLIAKAELPFATSKFPSSRYSLLRVQPQTGRMHQIRKHFAKIRHYLIGDTTHGDLKQNIAFSNYTNANGLMLHAHSLSMIHPRTSRQLYIQADIPERFELILPFFNLDDIPPSNLERLPADH